MMTVEQFIEHLRAPVPKYRQGESFEGNKQFAQCFRPREVPDCGRDMLPDVFRELGYTVGVEVGVCRGDYSEHLCKTMPDATIISVDAWEVGHDPAFSDTQVLSDNEQCTRDRLAKYPNSVILKCPSTTAAKMFPPQSLDFVYIDADHRFVSVVEDMCAWITRIRPGGILAGHDYKNFKVTVPSHVPEAVAGFCMAFHINPCCVLGRTHAPVEPYEFRDRLRSWCFFVPDRPLNVYNTEHWNDDTYK